MNLNVDNYLTVTQKRQKYFYRNFKNIYDNKFKKIIYKKI